METLHKCELATKTRTVASDTPFLLQSNMCGCIAWVQRMVAESHLGAEKAATH